MPIAAIGLLLLSAALHATWNLLLKLAGDKFLAAWWALVVGAGVSLVGLLVIHLPPARMWPFAVISSLTEAAYFWLLSYGYQDHDFTLIYPIGRGTAPAFLTVWSVLFLNEKFTPAGMLGLGLIILGLLIIGASSLVQNGIHGVPWKGLAIALSIALLISIYTVIDGASVQHGPAMSYGFLLFLLMPLPLAPFVMRTYGWPKLVEGWIAQRTRLLTIGVISFLAYLLALIAYSIALVGYAGAIREVTVVMGAFAGWQFLGEKLGGIRVVGAIVMFAGILVIALLG